MREPRARANTSAWSRATLTAVGFSILGIYGTPSLGLLIALGPWRFVLVFGPSILAISLILIALGSPAIILALVYWRPHRHQLDEHPPMAPLPTRVNSAGESAARGGVERRPIRDHLLFWAQVVLIEIGLIILESWRTLRDISLVPMAAALGLTLVVFICTTTRLLVRLRHDTSR